MDSQQTLRDSDNRESALVFQHVNGKNLLVKHKQRRTSLTKQTKQNPSFSTVDMPHMLVSDDYKVIPHVQGHIQLSNMAITNEYICIKE